MTFVDDLAAANPVRDETPYGDARAAALIADITAGRVTAPPPPPAPTRRPWLVGGIAVAAAATLAGVLIIPPVLRHDAQVSPGLPVATSSVTPRPVPPTSASQYWKTVLHGTTLVGEGYGPSVKATEQRGVWLVPASIVRYDSVDPGRPGWSVAETGLGAATLVGGDGSGGPPARVRSVDREPEITRGSWARPDADWAAARPRDPQLLRQDLYASVEEEIRRTRMVSTPDALARRHAIEALESLRLPADLRHAMTMLLPTLPGITVQPAVLEGRAGTAYGYDDADNGMRVELMLDSASTDVIGWRGTTLGPRVGAAPVPVRSGVSMTIVVESRQLVDAISAEDLEEVVAQCALMREGPACVTTPHTPRPTPPTS
jgi:hypothetical protein